MKTPALSSAHEAEERGRTAVLRDYWQLTRPRIVAMVLFTLLVAALVGGDRIPRWDVLLHAVVGNGLVIVGAMVLNQLLERRTDAQMLRNAQRPLPAGRLSDRQASRFAAVTSLAGFACLALWGNWLVLVLAAASWGIYVWVYTPLKMLTAWQTPIGAVAGAMPALLGAAAAGAPFGATGLALFGIVYFWQFPHAMAIAWLYRHEFASAEVKLITVVDPSGQRAGWIAAFGAMALLPISLTPWLAGTVGWGYGGLAVLLGMVYLAASVSLLACPDDVPARRLLWISVLYLPLLLIGLVAAVVA